jgi:hypothetical protein
MTEAEEENLENYTNLGEFFRRKLKVTILLISASVFNAFIDPPGFRIIWGSWIGIRIRVKSWIRIRIKFKIMDF